MTSIMNYANTDRHWNCAQRVRIGTCRALRHRGTQRTPGQADKTHCTDLKRLLADCGPFPDRGSVVADAGFLIMPGSCV